MSKRNKSEPPSKSNPKKLKSNLSETSLTVPCVKSNDLQEILLNSNTYRLRSDFFNADCLDLSKSLLNKYLVRKIEVSDNQYALTIGKIVETEAYLGSTDKASHSYNDKQTDRTKAMYMQPGTSYVYNIYGVYCCLNISAKESGAAVLIRALEPFCGVTLMRKNRNLSENKPIKELTNGPSKLTMALAITKNDFNQIDLVTSENLWLQDELSAGLKEDIEGIEKSGDDSKVEIVCAERIGIDNAGEEAVNKLYRFYIKGNKFVSVKAKQEVIWDQSNI